MNKNIQTIVIGMSDKPGWFELERRVYSFEGISPTVTSTLGGGILK